ncbi:MAG: carbonic anhydrase [Pseudomonadota bacterium]
MTDFPAALLAGYQTFRDGRLTQERQRYKTLAEQGQKPETLIVACCDSRAAPEIIFDARPGEIFVVRNVANLVPPYEPSDRYHGTSAALEFAVQGLKVKNIVVLGHGRCGGVNAALNPMDEPLSPGDFIGKWIELLGPAAMTVKGVPDITDAERQTALERLSVRHSIDNLMTFPHISALVEKGRLTLHGAWFDISDGDLWIMDPVTGDFAPAGQIAVPILAAAPSKE